MFGICTQVFGKMSLLWSGVCDSYCWALRVLCSQVALHCDKTSATGCPHTAVKPVPPQPALMVSDSNMPVNCKRFEGKVAVVTAATAGIGLGIATRLGQEGAKLVICSRKQDNVDETLKQLRGMTYK